jgi:hypothetical protein
MSIDRATFEQQKAPRIGSANPEPMDFAFWLHMVQSGLSAAAARRAFAPEARFDDGGPVWSFDRFGPSRTQLSDGRVICVGGEHEDFYDPDFFIYNDVIVVRPDGAAAIYGYPRESFSPTDFHTATLLDDRIIIIGGLGYRGQRGGVRTPVYSLNLQSLAISRITTGGEYPGWIYEHQARLMQDGQTIRVWGGKRLGNAGGSETFGPWPGAAELDTRTWTWREVPPEPARVESPAVLWPEPWEPVLYADREEFLMNDLRRVVPPGHALFACNVQPLASALEALLLQLLDGSGKVAEIQEPDLEFEHAVLPEPRTAFYPNLEAWLASKR